MNSIQRTEVRAGAGVARRTSRLLIAGAVAVLQSCGGSAPAELAAPSASKGQVKPATSQAKVSFYAASRFAEQATFGPTPGLIAEIQAKGFEKWIDDQIALPPTVLDSTPARPESRAAFVYVEQVGWDPMLNAPDQLRHRLVWTIGQFITVSGSKGHQFGTVEWINSLQRWAFLNYGDLLYNVSIHPKMAEYLDNNQNRPKSAECPRCAPNENYARELMQLFSIGVVRVNPDGTPIRNSRGGYVETYTQTDVEQLARVLTGWTNNSDPFGDELAYWLRPMIPSTWAPDRDSGAKQVLGKTFPAGQSAEKDLRDAIDLLITHPNAAPFVSLRLIQHHVKSSPTPAYVGRVAAIFRNNGRGVVGDLKAVVKAVLLDPEARAGDDPTKVREDDGLIRESVLHRTAVMRALGCKKVPRQDTGWGFESSVQGPWWPESVFSFYAPTDRAPGSNLLAPEQKLLVATEFQDRLGRLDYMRWDPTTSTNGLKNFSNAGCSLDALIQAFARSPADLSNYLSQAFFRGAMPPPLRAYIEQLMVNAPWEANSLDAGAVRVLEFALTTPYFGVIL